MDSHKINMYAGAAIGAVLVFLLLNFFSDMIYGTRGHTAHGELAFAVEVEDAGQGGGTAEVEVIDYAALMASADPAKGEKVFGKCKSCHSVEPDKSGVGPSLHGIVNRAVASAAGFGYSDPMKAHGGAWDVATLAAFLQDPKGAVPGTKMSFGGLKSSQDVADVISYLEQIGAN
jgi:cytochrome c